MTEIIVDVMVHVLRILSLLTKEVKEGKLSELILLAHKQRQSQPLQERL
jgi:hypothetical protein